MGNRRTVGWRRLAVGVPVALLGVAAVAGGLAGPVDVAHADVVTHSGDNLRTGWDDGEPALTQGSVGSPNFGQLFSAPVDGQVYAQPLVVGKAVIAATENNKVYGLDTENGARKWVRDIGPAWPASAIGCGDLVPNVGVTSTPVYDSATNSVYLLAKTNDGPSTKQPRWLMHSLDPATGVERAGFPVAIAGSPTNDPGKAFNPYTAMQRPGLLLSHGVVYASFASHCDTGPYVGYVVGVSTAGKQTTMWATESGNAFGGAGIWQSGSGLVDDGAGHIYFATGNGISPPPGPGKQVPTTLGESIVELTVGADGNLTPTDFFSPADNSKLDEDDTDLGSGGPTAIPDGYGTTEHPHLLVHVGKDGRVYLLDRDDLGGMGQGTDGTDAVLDAAGPYNGVWGKSAFFGTVSGGDKVGYVYNVGNNGYLRAFKISPTSGGGVALAAVGASVGTFGYTSGSPVITSNGTDPSSALVWVTYVDKSNGDGGQLRAYRAMPDSNGKLQQVFSAPIGVGAKFVSVATQSGRVYLGTRDGRVFGFGAPTTAAFGATATDLGSAPVGQAVSGTVTVTAARDVTLSGATATAPFAVSGTVSPVHLAKGGTTTVPVTFSPDRTGQLSGVLSLSTDDGETVALDLRGLGTKEGLGATPEELVFEDVPTGTASQETVNVVNTGTTNVTISSVAVPTAASIRVDPATVPKAGTVLKPQASVPLSVRYTPTTTTPVDDSIIVSASGADPLTVPVTATAIAGAAHLDVPASLDFGDVGVGTSSTLTFEIKNTGNIPMTITKAKAPAGVFTTTDPISEGLVIPPGETAYQPVTFTPSKLGKVGDSGTYYLITTNDGTSAHLVMLTGNGINDPIAVLAAQGGAGHYGTKLGFVLTNQYAVGNGKCQDFTTGYVCWSPATGAHMVYGTVADRYQVLGGPKGALGLPTSDQTSLPGGGMFTHFAGSGGSSIYWSQATGAHAVSGPVRDKWAASGWEYGPLGYPVSDQTAIGNGGAFVHFAGGSSIYYSPATGAHTIGGAVRDKWGALGWENSPLGYPVSDQTALANGGAFAQFAAGTSIYYSPATGAHTVGGAVRDKWGALGWEYGPLGYPVSDQTAIGNGGAFVHFAGGTSIYFSPATGAHTIGGAVRDKWGALGWENSPLGYPVSDQTPVRDGGSFVHFAGLGGSSIYFSPATGAHSISGPIRDKWALRGWENSALGFPVTDVASLPGGGQYAHFAGSGGSSIYWSEKTGAHAIGGAVRDKWAAQGWERGPLGFPISDQTGIRDGGQYADFDGNGSIYYSPATGAHTMSGQVRFKWAAQGWEVGPLGYPTSDVQTTPDGQAQFAHFAGQGGSSIYWTQATGAHSVQGLVRDKWAALGWERGLGYPTSDEYDVTGGRRSDFQRGSLAYDRASGAVRRV